MEEDLCTCRVIHRQTVEAARGDSQPPEVVEGLSQLFKALADPSRLRILHALDKREMCVCDLAALLQISESAVSHQLRLLRTLKLVANRRDGTILYYRLYDRHVTILLDIAFEHLQEGEESRPAGARCAEARKRENYNSVTSE